METLKMNTILGVIILLSVQYLQAQSETLKESRKAQVTFAYPVGSAGISSRNYINNFSFNILYGLNGGVNGFELGSLWNHNDGNVTGFQLSGLGNSTIGTSRGLLLSGLVNINSKVVKGVSVSGILNYSRQSLIGLQLAGITNFGNDSLKGVAVSGILNLTKGHSRGVHVSTINLAEEFEGIQIGVLNRVSWIKGVQLGFINISKEGKDVIPIGLINVIRNNGYYELDLTGGEAIYANLSFKMGVERLFTILKTGFSVYQDKPVYSWGGGFGSGIPLSEKQHFNIEVTSSKIVFDNDWFGDHTNSLNKLDLNYKYNIFNSLSLLIGPSFNVYITSQKIEGEYGIINVPYTIYEHESADKKLFMWIGLNAGVSFEF